MGEHSDYEGNLAGPGGCGDEESVLQQEEKPSRVKNEVSVCEKCLHFELDSVRSWTWT